jgi:hypothetical protein
MLSLFASPSSFKPFETGTSGKYTLSKSSPAILLSYVIIENCSTFVSHNATFKEPRTLPAKRKRAVLLRAASAPRGFQLNLYRRGVFSMQSGAGRPPQKDVNAVICFFCARRDAISACAEQWSNPGSSPTSFNRSTSAAIALPRPALVCLN